MAGKGIFRDRRVFSTSYIPAKILHRDKEMANLANNLERVIEGNRPNDVILYGKPGTGRTLTVRYVTGELQKATTNVIIFHINLYSTKSSYTAWQKIARVVTGRDVTMRSSTDISNYVFEFLITLEQRFIIFVLDRISEVTKGYDDVLYHLLRPYEVVPKLNKELCCIFISNSIEYLGDLSERTSRSFKLVDKYVYDPYTAPQLADILNDRAEIGLNEGTYDKAVIALCAEYCAKEHGDARRAICLLGKAAEIASMEKVSSIKLEHVNQARGD